MRYLVSIPRGGLDARSYALLTSLTVIENERKTGVNQTIKTKHHEIFTTR